jgi:hypothetical protein
VVRKELRGNWRYTCEARTFDAQNVAIVVEIEARKEADTEILVITVWALD